MDTEDNIEIVICSGQGVLRSPSALCSLYIELVIFRPSVGLSVCRLNGQEVNVSQIPLVFVLYISLHRQLCVSFHPRAFKISDLSTYQQQSIVYQCVHKDTDAFFLIKAV